MSIRNTIVKIINESVYMPKMKPMKLELYLEIRKWSSEELQFCIKIQFSVKVTDIYIFCCKCVVAVYLCERNKFLDLASDEFSMNLDKM